MTIQKYLKPKVSIITVVRNGEKDIEETCKSVVSQTYKNYEWVVIDGLSTDRTLDIVNKYKKYINVLISEKDKSNFDAMNKGIKVAKGEYLIFLNGGDAFNSANVLKNVFGKNQYTGDVLYGNCHLINEDGSDLILDFKENLDKYYLLDICINHQSTFIKRSLFEKFGLYSQDYFIIADYEKWLCFLNGKAKFQKVPHIVADYKGFGGKSTIEKYRKQGENDKERAIKKHFKWWELLSYQLKKRLH